MRFFSDSQLSIPVKWFWAEEEAKLFPTYTRFGSGNWASDRFDWDGPGEVLEAPRPWRNGESPGEMLGQIFAGPLTAFREGATSADPPLQASEEGLCCACTCIGCPCLEWMSGLPPEMTVEVTGVTTLIPPAIAHVGQKLRFSRHAIPGEPNAQRGPDFVNPANPFEAFTLWLSCNAIFPGGSKFLMRGDSFAPSSGANWEENSCDPFDFTITGWPVSFGFPPTLYELWNLRLRKGHVP